MAHVQHALLIIHIHAVILMFHVQFAEHIINVHIATATPMALALHVAVLLITHIAVIVLIIIKLILLKKKLAQSQLFLLQPIQQQQ